MHFHIHKMSQCFFKILFLEFHAKNRNRYLYSVFIIMIL